LIAGFFIIDLLLDIRLQSWQVCGQQCLWISNKRKLINVCASLIMQILRAIWDAV